MTAVLFDDTPLHRDNFLKLINEQFFNDTLFHRVIKGFMIQGGDPNTKDPDSKRELWGTGDVGYTIPAEFLPEKHFHVKGALAAARKGDEVNPDKQSSGCQFYIVQGKKFSKRELKRFAEYLTEVQRQKLEQQFLKPFAKQLLEARVAHDEETLNSIHDNIARQIDEALTPATFSDAQIEAYTTVGGTPTLDGEYTVFGQVTEGFDIIDLIAKQKTDNADHPYNDIVIYNISVIS